MNDEAGRAPQDVYWSIEACGWVRSPAQAVAIPEPRVVTVTEQVPVRAPEHDGPEVLSAPV